MAEKYLSSLYRVTKLAFTGIELVSMLFQRCICEFTKSSLKQRVVIIPYSEVSCSVTLYESESRGRRSPFLQLPHCVTHGSFNPWLSLSPFLLLYFFAGFLPLPSSPLSLDRSVPWTLSVKYKHSAVSCLKHNICQG